VVVADEFDQVLGVEDADDVIEVLIEDGDAAVSYFEEKFEARGGR